LEKDVAIETRTKEGLKSLHLAAERGKVTVNLTQLDAFRAHAILHISGWPRPRSAEYDDIKGR
jgi:hypothetical protein